MPDPTSPALAAPAAVAADRDPEGAAFDRRMRRHREWVATILGGMIVLGAMVLMVVAVLNLDTQRFDRVKDLLLFINPLIGVVIGYYFTKVSTEARAETAESAASTAMAAAQREAVARQAAAAEAEESWEHLQEARTTLAEVSEAAESMLEEEGEAVPGTLGGAERPRGGVASLESRLALQAALARAKRLPR